MTILRIESLHSLSSMFSVIPTIFREIHAGEFHITSNGKNSFRISQGLNTNNKQQVSNTIIIVDGTPNTKVLLQIFLLPITKHSSRLSRDIPKHLFKC